jgi:hypothetical protein
VHRFFLLARHSSAFGKAVHHPAHHRSNNTPRYQDDKTVVYLRSSAALGVFATVHFSQPSAVLRITTASRQTAARAREVCSSHAPRVVVKHTIYLRCRAMPAC